MEQQIMERFPGIGCAWRNAAGKEAAEYAGAADEENHVLVDENTIFPACSISKFITAICAMKLHEKKMLDIDAPVNDYLRQWKLLTLDGHASNASIRALFNHTAGIVDGEESFHGLRRSNPEIGLLDILEGKTAYNNRPVRAEKPQGTVFEYTDAGFCVLQMMMQEVMHKPFEEIAWELVFGPVCLKSTFFASPENVKHFENRMSTGYDENGQPLPGRFPPVPDLAASGLWSTPKELLTIGKEWIAAFHGRSDFLREKSAREMAKPAERFPWVGLGIFLRGNDTLVSQGWGENGQCMLKMNCRTEEISVVMTNCDSGVDQAASGVEGLADKNLTK